MNQTPINSHCPWSGDPVSADSQIEYRGRVVAFCNPGCRDKFGAAMQHFDAIIDAQRDGIPSNVGVLEHRPRGTDQ
ncbi:MAG: glutathione S-transferase [Planctomycetota bacterium]